MGAFIEFLFAMESLGNKKPLSDDCTSNIALSCGDVVPTPICAFKILVNVITSKKND